MYFAKGHLARARNLILVFQPKVANHNASCGIDEMPNIVENSRGGALHSNKAQTPLDGLSSIYKMKHLANVKIVAETSGNFQKRSQLIYEMSHLTVISY